MNFTPTKNLKQKSRNLYDYSSTKKTQSNYFAYTKIALLERELLMATKHHYKYFYLIR